MEQPDGEPKRNDYTRHGKMAKPKKEPIEAIADVVEAATDVTPTCGEGHDLADFLTTKATASEKGTRIFVAYHGFTGGEIYTSGQQSDNDTENYTIYIHAGNNVRETVNKIKRHLRTDENMIFTDTTGEMRVIAATGGAAMRENGFGVYEMNIRVT